MPSRPHAPNVRRRKVVEQKLNEKEEEKEEEEEEEEEEEGEERCCIWPCPAKPRNILGPPLVEVAGVARWKLGKKKQKTR